VKIDNCDLASIFMQITSKLPPLPSKVAALEGNLLEQSSDFTFTVNCGSSYSESIKVLPVYDLAHTFVLRSK